MEISNHGPISRLSRRYAESLGGGDDARFTRESLAAAYIVGAVATLRRICLLIDASAKAERGLDGGQAQRLLRLITHTEMITDGWPG